MGRSNIDYVDQTWNPVTGCRGASKGCDHCWAAAMVRRFKTLHDAQGAPFSEVRLHEDALDKPALWKPGSRGLVCALGDLFGYDVPTPFLDKVFKAMASYPENHYLILTKQAKHMRDYVTSHPQVNMPHVWWGISVESRDTAFRLDYLLQTPVYHRWLSYEPAIGPLTLPAMQRGDLGWIVMGGESGPHARPLRMAWAKNMQRQARRLKIPLFFKQWGLWFPREEWIHNPHLDLPEDAACHDSPGTMVYTTQSREEEIYHRLGKKGGCTLGGKAYHEFPRELTDMSESRRKEPK